MLIGNLEPGMPGMASEIMPEPTVREINLRSMVERELAEGSAFAAVVLACSGGYSTGSNKPAMTRFSGIRCLPSEHVDGYRRLPGPRKVTEFDGFSGVVASGVPGAASAFYVVSREPDSAQVYFYEQIPGGPYRSTHPMSTKRR